MKKKVIYIIAALFLLSACATTKDSISSQRSEFYRLQKKEAKYPYKHTTDDAKR